MQAEVRDRVLLVDDEPQILVALEDVLSEKFVVFKAESGEGALEVLAREPDIAVVVTDQRMPKMTGDELFSPTSPSHGTPTTCGSRWPRRRSTSVSPKSSNTSGSSCMI
jgi:response regulator RpfG family c-di-GMP phosphodiesterase